VRTRIRGKCGAVLEVTNEVDGCVSDGAAVFIEMWSGTDEHAHAFLTDTGIDRLIGILESIRIRRAGVAARKAGR
jgi:hypothetical protein